jgi:hypothetical protein
MFQVILMMLGHPWLTDQFVFSIAGQRFVPSLRFIIMFTGVHHWPVLSQVSPVHTAIAAAAAAKVPYRKDIWGSGAMAPLFLTLTINGDEWSASCLRKQPPIPTVQEAQWAPKLV